MNCKNYEINVVMKNQYCQKFCHFHKFFAKNLP